MAGPVKEIQIDHNPLGKANPSRPAGGIAGHQLKPRHYESPGELLERSRVQADRIIKDADRQAESVQRDGYHAGFEQGEKAGAKLAHQKMEPVLDTLQKLIEVVSHDREQLIKKHEHELVKIAFSIALQVVRRQVEMEPDLINGIVAAALGKVSRSQHVTLKLNPKDHELLEQQKEKSELQHWREDHLQIELDDSIAPGGCRVVTEIGEIDALIDTQLHMIKNMLWEDQPVTRPGE
jgi:flagellar assembly protein FliH